MLKVVFDTNVYISAILFGGIPRQLLLEAFERHFQLYLSDEILTEISAVLRKKFKYPPSRVQQVTRSLKILATLVHPIKTLNIIKNWPADNRILECCLQIEADYLVSGDKRHLLPLKKLRQTKIITPKEFLSLIK